MLDIEEMAELDNESFDVINSIEVFEHVQKPEKGLAECHRVLKSNGSLILSIPFMYPTHSLPQDYQRWTEEKWKKELTDVGFKVEEFERMGLFLTVLMDMCKALIKQLPKGVRHLFIALYPVMGLILRLDHLNIIRQNEKLNKYRTGYFTAIIQGEINKRKQGANVLI